MMSRILTRYTDTLVIKGVVARRGISLPRLRECYSTVKELQTTDLLDAYRGLVAQGRLEYNKDQIRAVMELRRLHKRLADYAPPAFVSSGVFNMEPSDKSNHEWWSQAAETSANTPELKSLVLLRSQADEIAGLDTPKGLLLTGPPGSGKSMLIDLWFSLLPTPYKVRKHYSTLVLEIYRGVWEETRRRQVLSSSYSRPAPYAPWNKVVRERWRALFASGTFPSLRSPRPISMGSSPMPNISYSIAHRLLLRHWLLVFDEIQLLDVSSAGLLSDVLSWFWRMGGVVVGSSNKIPDDLYRHGVQRERLGPFIEALKLRCPVFHLRNTIDYRKLRAGNGFGKTWFIHGQEREFEAAVEELAKGGKPGYDTIDVFGRPVSIHRISKTTCRFTFEELCNRSLGPADYVSIASRYSTVVLTEVPTIRTDAKNQGRRFISLIDALYESRCRLICTSEVNMDRLFFPDNPETSFEDSNESLMMAESVSETKQAFRPNISSYDSLPHSQKTRPEHLNLQSLSIFSGEEERFAYQRAHSRLLQMTSATYSRENEWQPLSIEDRKWETGSIMSRKELLAKPSPDSSEASGDDFAAEAAYSQIDGKSNRPPAPVLSADNVWGVREDWGPRAKAWGKGARIHNKGRGGNVATGRWWQS